MCQTDDPITSRYTNDIIDLHRNAKFGRLSSHVRDQHDLLHYIERPDGLVTFAARTDQLPHRYVVALGGFRLAQYLQLGWACPEIAYRGAMFCESSNDLHPDDVHVVTLSGTGEILGYLALATTGGEQAEPLSSTRTRFPVETAHNINIFEYIAPAPGVHTDQVRELKRFVHARTLVDRTQRLRVTLELLLGTGRTLTALEPRVRTLVGDVEERVALRHLVLAGLDVHLVEGTTPALPDTEVMHLAYDKRGAVKPFVAHVPELTELAARVELLEATLSSPDLFVAAAGFSRERPGTTERIAA